jgi:2-hydroxycyclohexanecarboxyl-CoA dehydrogenase
MDLGFGGQVAVVVGAARGLGAAIADAFAAEGARVARWDIDPAAETVVDATDFTAVTRAAGRLGRVDHVVYAAAVGSGKFGFPFWSLAPADWPRVLNVNLMGAVNVAHAFAPRMAEQRGGTLLFLASVAGQNGSQTDPPYSAAKAAVLNFTKCAAKDLAPFGVRVNALCPGMVKTPLNRAVWQAWADRQPPEARVDYDEWAAD